MAIFLKRGATLVELLEQPYGGEDVLQQLLADHPNLLAGDEDGRRRRWLLVQREMGVADAVVGEQRWSLDHLFLDEQAVPTLVEVKRSSDTRIRREVVGQMLDYAANASASWDAEAIRGAFEANRRAAGSDPDDELGRFLGPDGDAQRFWDELATNLLARRLRLVFVADVIPHELGRIVEFLNEQMTSTEVVAVEIRQYVAPDGQTTTLVPRFIGRTEAARDTKRTTATRSRNRWSERDLLGALREAQPAELAERMVALYQFLRDAGARASWGTGVQPSVTLWLGEREDEQHNPVSVGIYTEGVAINFDFVRDRRTEAEMHRLATLMRSVPGVGDYIEGLEEQNWGMHRGMKPADVLGSDEALAAFQRAVVDAATPGVPGPPAWP
jgi:hypothetical protein